MFYPLRHFSGLLNCYGGFKAFLFALVSLTGNEVHAQDTLLPFIENGNWGAVNVQNEIIISPKFEFLSSYRNNMAIAKSNGRYGVLDEKGGWITPANYKHLERVKLGATINESYFLKSDVVSVSDSLLIANDTSGTGIIDCFGNEIIPLQFDIVTAANSNMAVGSIQGKYVVFHLRKGEIVLKDIEDLNYVGDDFIVVVEDQMQVIYDLEGKELWKGEFNGVEEELGHLILDLGRTQKILLNKDGEEVINSSKIDRYPESNCIVNQKNGKQGVYSLKQSEWLYTDKVSEISEFARGKFLVRKNKKVGIVDMEGAIRIPIEYDRLDYSENGILAMRNDSVGLYDFSYNLMVPCEFETIDKNDMAYIPGNSGLFGLYDLRGNKLAEVKFKHFKFKENVAYGFGNGKTKEFHFPEYNAPTNKIKVKYNVSYSNQTHFPDCWFQDTVFYGANKNVFKMKWGLRYDRDSIAIKPKYRQIELLPHSNLTRAYMSRLSRDNDKLLQLNYKYSLPFYEFFDVVNHEDREKKERTLFYSLNENDFENGAVARARTPKNLVLINNEGVIIDKISYAADYSDDMMRYCYTSKYPLYTEEANDYSFDAFAYWGVYYDFLYFKNPMRYPVLPREINVSFLEAKWGYVNSEGKIKFPRQFDFAHDYQSGYALVESKGKIGLVDKDTVTIPLEFQAIKRLTDCGDTIFVVMADVKPITRLVDSLCQPIPKKFLNVKRIGDDLITARTKEGWGVLNDQLQWELTPQFPVIIDAFQDYMVYRSKNKVGIASMSGSNIVPPVYKGISNYKQGCFIVEKNKKYGVVNSVGEEIVPLKYKEVKVTEQGILVGNAMFDFEGELIIKPRYDRIDLDESTGNLMFSRKGNTIIKNRPIKYKVKLKGVRGKNAYSDCVVAFSKDGRGEVLLDLKGKQLTSSFEEITLFKDSLYTVRTKKKYGLITSSGKVLLEAKYRDVLEVKPGEYAGTGITALVVNSGGDTLCEGQYIEIKKFSDGFMMCRKGRDSYIYLNEDYRNIFHREFLSGYSFEHQLAPVKTSKGWCLINTMGEEVNVPSFHQMEPLGKNVYQAKYSLNRGVYSGSGREIAPPIFEHVEYIGMELFQLRRNGKVGYVDINGNWLFNPFEDEIAEHKKRE